MPFKIVYRNAQNLIVLELDLDPPRPSLAAFAARARALAPHDAVTAEMQETQWVSVNEGGTPVQHAFTDCFDPAYVIQLERRA